MTTSAPPGEAGAGTGRRPTRPSTAAAILAVVDAPEPPLRIFLGSFPFPVAERVYAERLATWQRWRAVAETAA